MTKLPPKGAPAYIAPKAHSWASYIPGRKPAFKTHTNKAMAFSAIGYILYGWPRGGILYELQKGKWVELFRYEPPTYCPLCGESMDVKGHQKHHRIIDHKWRERTAHWSTAAIICSECYNQHLGYKGDHLITWQDLYKDDIALRSPKDIEEEST